MSTPLTEVERINVLLPTELFAGSKDWRVGSIADRVEWLLTMYSSAKEEVERLQSALEAQPQQEPVFCEHCGGNDEDPQDHCMDCTRPRWEPVTQELLNQQHPWLYEPMWIAMKGGTVLQGIYEWRQGRNPDRFITDGGDDWAFDAAYVMPIVQPKPPTAEAAHQIGVEK